jgi:hypothetical protein
MRVISRITVSVWLALEAFDTVQTAHAPEPRSSSTTVPLDIRTVSQRSFATGKLALYELMPEKTADLPCSYTSSRMRDTRDHSAPIATQFLFLNSC